MSSEPLIKKLEKLKQLNNKFLNLDQQESQNTKKSFKKRFQK